MCSNCPSLLSRSVSTVPGQTAFTVMPAGPSSWAITCVSRIDTGLGGAVRAEHREAALAGLRRDVDDAPVATRGQHALRAGTRDDPRALQVHVDHAVPLALRDVQQRSDSHAQRRRHRRRCTRGRWRRARRAPASTAACTSSHDDTSARSASDAPAEGLDLAHDLVELVGAGDAVRREVVVRAVRCRGTRRRRPRAPAAARSPGRCSAGARRPVTRATLPRNDPFSAMNPPGAARYHRRARAGNVRVPGLVVRSTGVVRRSHAVLPIARRPGTSPPSRPSLRSRARRRYYTVPCPRVRRAGAANREICVFVPIPGQAGDGRRRGTHLEPWRHDAPSPPII